MKTQKSPLEYSDRMGITPLMRLLLAFCIVFTATVVQPQAVHAASPGWIVSCNYSHSLTDDPIVFPRQPGAAHLHDFVGGRTANAFSTPISLRAGGTTCAVSGDASSYWVPALYEDGARVLPAATSKNALFYYRRKGAPTGTIVQPFPDGLRIIIGNAHAKSPQENPQLGKDIIFKCGPGSGTDLPAPPAQCDSGILVLSLRFPNCWDGVHLDSADHRSHMAYPASGRCPKTHPVVLPRLESFFRYKIGTGPIGKITLSSGPYYTAHQDFFNAWDPAVLKKLVTNCLNALVDCGTNPSVSGMTTSALLPVMNTPTPTITAMPTRTPMSMPTNTPLPMPTLTLEPTFTSEPPATDVPPEVPTEVPTEIPPTVEPTHIMP
ncbi:MAG TPA: DUF1996 domain-containing protein [Anaerolineales bacterium]|nr:DUF1996 domain-containing protein [Anaerolineales bacterium]